MNRSELARIARKHGTPVVVIDHDEVRRNYASSHSSIARESPWVPSASQAATEMSDSLPMASVFWR